MAYHFHVRKNKGLSLSGIVSAITGVNPQGFWGRLVDLMFLRGEGIGCPGAYAPVEERVRDAVFQRFRRLRGNVKARGLVVISPFGNAPVRTGALPNGLITTRPRALTLPRNRRKRWNTASLTLSSTGA